MESKPTAVDAAAEVIVETLKTPVPLPIAIKDPSPSTIISDTVTTTVEPTVEIATPAISNDVWKQVTQLWDEYFGEGKKSNLTIAIIVITTIPLLIAASALLDFLNKLPLLPSGLSIFYLWVKTLETDTCLSRCELPIYRLLGMIALSVPSRCFLF